MVVISADEWEREKRLYTAVQEKIVLVQEYQQIDGNVLRPVNVCTWINLMES